MPPTVSNQTSGTHSSPLSFNSRKGLWLVLVLIVILAGGLYLHDRSKNTSKSNASHPYAYTYKSLHNYQLTGPSAGNGMSFSVPGVLTTTKASGNGETQADFEQQAKSGQNPSVVIAELAASTVPTGSAFTSYSLKVLNTNMNSDVGSSAYKTATTTLKEFVSQRLSSGLSLSLGKATALHTANISANAWQLAVSAAPRAGSGSKGQPTLQGTAILAAGKSTYYYFFVDSVNYNWTANSSTWQQVISSLKIDQ